MTEQEFEHKLRNKEAALKLRTDAFEKLKKQSDATYIEGCRIQGELNSLTELNSHNERVIETQKSAIAHLHERLREAEIANNSLKNDFSKIAHDLCQFYLEFNTPEYESAVGTVFKMKEMHGIDVIGIPEKEIKK